MNAASSRAGKKILGKLQEATQSHQVATQSADKALAGSSTPGKTPLTGGHLICRHRKCSPFLVRSPDGGSFSNLIYNLYIFKAGVFGFCKPCSCLRVPLWNVKDVNFLVGEKLKK